MCTPLYTHTVFMFVSDIRQTLYKDLLSFTPPARSIFCFSVFMSFFRSTQQPIKRQPLRDSFITIHNGWIVCSLQKNKCVNSIMLLLISFNLLSASVLQHQVPLCNRLILCMTFHRTFRVWTHGLPLDVVGGCRGKLNQIKTEHFFPPTSAYGHSSQSVSN